MVEYDLTHKIARYLDPHMVFPLFEFLSAREIYDERGILMARLHLAQKTNMVDHAVEVFQTIYPDQPVPDTFAKKRAEILEQLEGLKTRCEPIINVIISEEGRAKMQQRDPRIVIDFLEQNYKFKIDYILSEIYQYAKFSFECGNYDAAVQQLAIFRNLVSSEDKRHLPALWGNLAAEILRQNWDGALDNLNRLRDQIENMPRASQALQMHYRTWLIHWSLFVHFNHRRGPELIIEMFFRSSGGARDQPGTPYCDAVQTMCPHILRYITAAIIASDRRKDVLKALIRLIQAEAYNYHDPVTEFVECLYVNFDFDKAQLKLRDCEQVLANDFFLCGLQEQFMDNARLLVFESFCRMHKTISITNMAAKLNLTPDEAERWIVKLITSDPDFQDAKIDSQNGLVIINTELPSPDNQLVDLTKGICGQAQALVAQIQKRLQLMGIQTPATIPASGIDGGVTPSTHMVTASGFDGAASDGDDIFSQIAKGSVDVPVTGGETLQSSSSSAVPPSPSSLFDRLWYPSAETATVIEKVLSQPSSREEPDIAAGRTVPVIYAEKQNDPVRELLVAKGRIEVLSARAFPTSSQVSKDVNGLKQLIASRCFRSALNLTSELLARSLTPTNMSSSYLLTDVEHNIFGARFSLLARLNMASIAEFEMQPFCHFDNPDLYAEFFDQPAGEWAAKKLLPGSYCSLVPFSSRLLHAQLPQFLQRFNEALDRLNNLLRSIEKMLSQLSAVSSSSTSGDLSSEEIQRAIAVWKRRREDTLFAICNVFVQLKSYREAADVFERLLGGAKSTTAESGAEDDASRTRSLERKCRMAGLAGRAFLQSGCLPYAESFFSRAVSLAPTPTFGEFLTNLHSGYMAMSAGQFIDAADHFEQAFIKAGSDNTLKVQVVTCVAVAIMYSGRLQAAIDRLELVLFAEPSVYTVEPLLINLSTMYELHQSNTADSRKLRLLDLVAQYCGDGFDTSCLKLSAEVVPPPPPSTAAGAPPPSSQAPPVLQQPQQQTLPHPLAQPASSFPARR